MKFKTKSKLATAIILIISGTAFLAGFLQESYASEVAEMNFDLENRQVVLSRMQTHVNFYTQTDLMIWEKSNEYYFDASSLDHAYGNLYSNLTSAERENYLSQISLALELSQNNMRVEISDMCVHFLDSTDDFIIRGEGYNFTIAITRWNEWNSEYGIPIEVMTPFEYYGHFESYEDIQALPLNGRPQNNLFNHLGYGQEEFPRIIGWVPDMLPFFLGYELSEYYQETLTLQREIATLEALISQIGLGVSLTAVAVILSSAMGNRINQRKTDRNFDILKQKEGIRIEKKKDLISIPVLIIATLVSILGIVLPMFSIIGLVL